MRTFVVFLLFIALSLGVAFAADSPKEDFDRGGRLYDEGKYAEALSCYEGLMSRVSSPDVFYNAGCAALKSGKKGLALAYWQRAFDARPRDNAIRTARSFLTAEIASEGGVIMRPSDLPVIGSFTENEIAIVVFASFFAVFLLAVVNLRLKRDFFWHYVWIGVLFIVSVTALSISMARFSGDYAVVTSPTAEVRESRNMEQDSFFVLKDGSEVRLLLDEDGWMRVSFETGDGGYHEGWIPDKDAVKI